MNFSPAIPPGGSTYFSLEAPPSAAAIMVGTPVTTAPATPKVPPAFGRNGVIKGLPSTHVCLSKRHFIIHIRRYHGISYVEALVFLNRRKVGVVKSRSGQFSSPINLRNLPAGTVRVKITVIATTGSIISGTRTYHTSDSRSSDRHVCDLLRRGRPEVVSCELSLPGLCPCRVRGLA